MKKRFDAVILNRGQMLIFNKKFVKRHQVCSAYFILLFNDLYLNSLMFEQFIRLKTLQKGDSR